MRKLWALVVAGLVAVALLATGGAVTGASSGVAIPEQRQGDWVGSGTYKPGLTVDLDGHIQRAATGTTTKTLVLNGLGCGNAHMAWDDSPAGIAYTATTRSTWNAGGTCGGAIDGTVEYVTMWGPGGQHDPRDDLGDTETDTNYTNVTGSGTTKFLWIDTPAEISGQAGDYHCAYLTPGSSFWDAYTTCSV